MIEGSQLDLPSGPFTRPFHIIMALFQLHQSIKMKRCWSLINLRIAVTLSFSEKIFRHVNGTYCPMFSLSLWFLITVVFGILQFLHYHYLSCKETILLLISFKNSQHTKFISSSNIKATYRMSTKENYISRLLFPR